MNLDVGYRLAQGVVVRNERFGGLVYRHDNRRLYFLHSHGLVEFVRELDGSRSLRECMDTFLDTAKLPETTRDTLLNAVDQLEKMGVVIPALEER